MGGQQALLALCLGFAGLAEAYVQPQRFLIISSPSTHNVYYATLPSLHELALPRQQRPVVEAKVLIDGVNSRCQGSWCYEDSDRGLRAPTGLALQQGCGSAVLFVSDTETQDLYAYELTENALGYLQAGPQRRVRQGIAAEAEWLAVDSRGNLFMTASSKNEVLSIPSRDVFTAENNSEPARVLYSAEKTNAVAAPGGVAADGFFVYWANQAGGIGPVARAPERAAAAEERPPEPVGAGGGAYEAMATNVCLARDNAFFTGTTGSLLAAKLGGNGKSLTEVASGFVQPAGCSYDGESTLYVADGGDNAVYSLPANMVNLRAVRHPVKVVSVKEPKQIAVFTGATKGRCPYKPLPPAPSAAAGTPQGLLALAFAIVSAAAI